MEIITAGTGSRGNCYLLRRNNGHYIALDCGVSWKKVLVACGFMPIKIDFALYTHSHTDHSSCVPTFIKNGIHVFGPDNLAPNKKKKIGDVSVIPFEVPHDVKCFGYIIQADGEKLIYITDFGYVKYTFQKLGIEHWLIACNHTDTPNIDEFKYAHVVSGHSSLQTVKDILTVNKTDNMRNVVLCHYSSDADTDRMEQEVKEIVGENVNVYLAQKGQKICLTQYSSTDAL